MSSYTAARLVPTGTSVDGRPQFRVVGAAGNGLWFYVGAPDSGVGVHVPEGFLTDRASWPGWLRGLLRLLGLGAFVQWVDACLAKAAIIHDRLREDLAFALVDCDALFLVALKADLPTWSGPRWAGVLLSEVAFACVRLNRSREQHNLVAASAVLLLVCAAVTGCADKPVRPREGAPIQLRLPADAEQCAAQPELDWCRHARR